MGEEVGDEVGDEEVLYAIDGRASGKIVFGEVSKQREVRFGEWAGLDWPK